MNEVDLLAREQGLHMELRMGYKNTRSRINEFALVARDIDHWAHPIENVTSDMPRVTRLAGEWLLGKEAAA